MAEHPEKIGKYSVHGVAGRGAMGVVYVGHDPFIDRDVAIKVCNIDDDDEATAHRSRRMFFNEAQSAGALDHPNILRVYDAGEADDQPYIVMEYVEGGEDLKPYCTAGSLLPPEQVVHYIHQCAKALDYAHRRGVAHRDIKPANIMLTRDREAKICDFGIAQRTSPDKTQVMGAFASPRYMSPEQARDVPLTHQTDLYSLGVTLFELLAGCPPYDAPALAQLVLAITTRAPKTLAEERPDLPPALSAIITKAMCKTLEDRYQTGAEMAADLAAVYDELTRPPEEITEEQKIALARGLRFFNDFSDDELDEVTSVALWETHASGTRIVGEGDVEQAFYVIMRGDATIDVAGKAVGSLSTGECFGEIGYLAGTKRIASVIAAGDVSVMKVDSALMEWASIPVQMRFNKVFQRVLIERLTSTTLELARHLP